MAWFYIIAVVITVGIFLFIVSKRVEREEGTNDIMMPLVILIMVAGMAWFIFSYTLNV